jgi:hypothetical protein
VRVVLRGIHKVKKRLASGEITVHFYAWRGGPAIHAKPGTPEFVHAYNEAHASVRRPTAGTLMTIIAEYKVSPDFTKLAPSSRRMYLMSAIEPELRQISLHPSRSRLRLRSLRSAISPGRAAGSFHCWSR